MSAASDKWGSPAWAFQSKADAQMDIAGAHDTGTNTVSDALALYHFTTGTAAASFGTGLAFNAENASGNDTEIASIDAVYTTATDSSEVADLVFNVAQAGTVTELMRLDGSADKVVIAGALEATTMTQTGALTVTVDDATANGVTDVAILGHTTSGTPAAGLGVGISLKAENSTPANTEIAYIDAVYTTTTASSEVADLIFGVAQGGTPSELMRLDGSANAIQLGVDIGDTVVLLGRVATGSVAGAALDITSAYTRGELFEIKTSVSDYTNIPQMDYDSLGNADIFTAIYTRAEVAVNGTDNGAVGIIGWGVANAQGCERVEGGRFWAYLKGDATKTVDYAWGVRGEFSMDAGRANSITLTEAAALAGRITSGKVADYTKIHGMVIRFGDMDGGSRTYGNGISLLDGPESGTSVLTNVINTDLVATNFLKVGASTQAGVTVAANGMTADPEGDAEAGYITIDVGGTGYQIPIYAA